MQAALRGHSNSLQPDNPVFLNAVTTMRNPWSSKPYLSVLKTIVRKFVGICTVPTVEGTSLQSRSSWKGRKKGQETEICNLQTYERALPGDETNLWIWVGMISVKDQQPIPAVQFQPIKSKHNMLESCFSAERDLAVHLWMGLRPQNHSSRDYAVLCQRSSTAQCLQLNCNEEQKQNFVDLHKAKKPGIMSWKNTTHSYQYGQYWHNHVTNDLISQSLGLRDAKLCQILLLSQRLQMHMCVKKEVHSWIRAMLWVGRGHYHLEKRIGINLKPVTVSQ